MRQSLSMEHQPSESRAARRDGCYGSDRAVAADLWQLHAAAAAAAGRRRLRACRGGARDGGAPRLGDALRERYPLSGKGAAAVLEHGGELPRLRCAHTWSARLPLALYTLLLLLAVFALGRRCFDDVWAGFNASLVLLTSFGLFIFTRILIPDAIVCLWLTLAMLCFWRSLARADARERRWIRGGMRAGRVDQGADRAGLSAADRPRVSGHDAQSPASAALASAAGCVDLFCDCRAVACGGGFGESYRGAPGCAAHAGQCAWVVLVLLRQRAPAAVFEPANPARLRHGAARALLGAAAGVAVAVERVPALRAVPGAAAPLVARCTVAWSGAGAAVALRMGGGADGLLQLLHPAGVLRAAGDAGARAARRRLAGRGRTRGHAAARADGVAPVHRRRLRCWGCPVLRTALACARRAIWRRRSARIPATTRSPSDTSST